MDSPEPEVVSSWYKALFEEDCVEVMQLLRNHPGLLEVGWRPEPSRMVTGRRGNYWMDETTSEWKGRTALHVAARRGCATLLKLVIILVHGFSGDDHDIFLRWDEELEQVLSQKELLTKLSKEGNELSDACEEPQIAPNSVRLGDILQTRRIDASLDLMMDLRDGEYQLDALAMASLHRNEEIQCLLLRNMRFDFPRLDRRDTWREIQMFFDAETSHESSQLRARLRATTENWWKTDGQDRWEMKSRLLSAYVEDRDFNFLPWGEYLFHSVHHLISRLEFHREFGNWATDLSRSLWRAVRWPERGEDSSSDSTKPLWKFLLQLQDGQRRTPFDVAVDASAIFELNFSLSCEDEEEMTVSDASGMTALQRAAALGSKDGRLSCLKDMREQTFPLGGNWEKKNVVRSIDSEYWSLTDMDKLSKQHGFKGRRIVKGKFVENAPVHSSIIMHSARNLDIICFGTNYLESYSKSGFDVNSDSDSNSHSDSDSDSEGEVEPGIMGAMRSVVQIPVHALRVGGSRILRAMKSLIQIPLHLVCVGGSSLCVGSGQIHRAKNSSDERGNREKEFRKSFLNPKSTFICWFNKKPCAFNPLDLAALLGDLSKVKRLLWLCKLTFPKGWTYEDNQHPITKVAYGPRAIHFAAHHGSYKMLTKIMDTPMAGYDPGAEDQDGNIALHYAMKMLPVKFEAHLWDYVSCEHLRENDPRNVLREKDDGSSKHLNENDLRNGLPEKGEKDLVNPMIVERKGCINRLLQEGCEIFKANRKGQIPYPSGDLRTNTDFLQWWYEKQSKEFVEISNTLSFASNAISVTATLVTTASYVGPLQPPLGYGDDDQMQAKNLWVKAFIVCDTLSFYLAIASITFSLIPSLPMPQQPMREELRRKQVMVLVATAILFPSIICILVAFASSSIAVTSAQGPSSTSGRLTIVTSAVGALICLVGFLLFCIRLLKFIFSRNKWIRTMYNLTSF